MEKDEIKKQIALEAKKIVDELINKVNDRKFKKSGIPVIVIAIIEIHKSIEYFDKAENYSDVSDILYYAIVVLFHLKEKEELSEGLICDIPEYIVPLLKINELERRLYSQKEVNTELLKNLSLVHFSYLMYLIKTKKIN